jgi:hypothetical protein
MNFLDPDEWHDLESLEKEHEELTEDLIKDLHTRLRPYFLRRIKSEVLSLPPKVLPLLSRSYERDTHCLPTPERSDCSSVNGSFTKEYLQVDPEYAAGLHFGSFGSCAGHWQVRICSSCKALCNTRVHPSPALP